MRVVLVVLVACSHPAAPADRAPVGSATVAPADAHEGAIAGDPPEPTAPVVECAFDRRVRCMPALANDRPYQQPPFEGCPATRPRAVKDIAFPDAKSQFSAVETRAARTKTPGVCCYIDFVATACD